MLSLAIATTLIGFALLVVGLVTGQVWFAIACIAICLIGVGLLVADVIRVGRRAKLTPSATPEADADVAPTRVVEPAVPQLDSTSDSDTAGWAPVHRQAAPAQPSPALPEPTQAQPAPVAAEGSFNDYVAATTGQFAGVAAAQVNTDLVDTGPVPRIDAVSGVRWESSIAPAQTEFIDREASNWSTSGWASAPQPSSPQPTPEPRDEQTGAGMHPRESATRSRHRHSDGALSNGASGMPKFDPLDPNWHPPAD